jgi:hypothetical protein
MSKLNVMKTIERTELNQHYGLSSGQAFLIQENSNDSFMMIVNAFKFGFAQGTKAERAKAKGSKRIALTLKIKSELKGITITLDPETAQYLDELKQKHFKDKTECEMFCEILMVGIAKAKAERSLYTEPTKANSV